MLDALFAAANDAFTLLLKKHAPKAFRREGRKLGFISFLHTFGDRGNIKTAKKGKIKFANLGNIL